MTACIKAVVSGCTGAFLIGLILVRRSNLALADTIQDLYLQGHLTVPSPELLPQLRQWVPVVSGSLFFVFTAGIALSLASLVLLALCFRLFRHTFIACGVYGCIWAGIALWASAHHASFETIGFVLALPLLCLGPMLKVAEPLITGKTPSWQPIVCFLAALAITAGTAATRADTAIFLNVRDSLFLSNPPGKMLNRFYYTYTLYASQAIASPFAREIKPCRIDPAIMPDTRLINILFRHGWLLTDTESPGTLRISGNHANEFVFNYPGLPHVTAGTDQFFKTPGYWLQKVSSTNDPQSLLRQICFAGLVFGFPSLLFLAMFYPVYFVVGKVTGPGMASLSAGAVSVCFAAWFLIYLSPGTTGVTPEEIDSMLASGREREQTRALRVIAGSTRQYRSLIHRAEPLSRGGVAQRYWLAKALGRLKTDFSINYLKLMARDPDLNVQCAAIRSLSMSGCGGGLQHLFQEVLTSSPYWYVQHYAYQALKPCL